MGDAPSEAGASAGVSFDNAAVDHKPAEGAPALSKRKSLFVMSASDTAGTGTIGSGTARERNFRVSRALATQAIPILEKIFAAVDGNHKGEIDSDEFQALATAVVEQFAALENFSFKIFDDDASGGVDLDEFVVHMLELLAALPDGSKVVVQRLQAIEARLSQIRQYCAPQGHRMSIVSPDTQAHLEQLRAMGFSV